MKKLTFAFACASTLALFAAPISVATFEGEGFRENKTVGGRDDNGSDSDNIYWQYKGASGSVDGSLVTAYGGDNLPVPTGSQLSGTPGSNYLNLSTEGGTLWRSVNANASDLGEPKAIADEGQIYIDTMVQFTATEDGGDPELAKDDNENYIDKLAIWMAKSTDSQGNEKVALCVMASAYDYVEGTPVQPATKFELKYADNTDFVPEAGKWYRLSVKAVTLCKGEITIQGFEIRVDGKLMKATTAPVGEGLMDALATLFGEKNLAKMANYELFPSLQPMGGADAVPTLTAVGFKGSGAIDDVTITEDELFGATVAVTGVTLSQTTAEITVGGDTLTLTATVAPENATDKTVKWTTSDEKIATVVDGVVTAVAAGEVTITAKAGDQSATCKVTVNPAAKQYPEYIAEADKTKYDAWVSAYGVTDRVDTGKALQAAYLLNVAPAEAEDETKKFAITSITVNADGTVTVDASKNSKGDLVNGKVEIWGAPALEGPWDLQTTGHKFFKAILK